MKLLTKIKDNCNRVLITGAVASGTLLSVPVFAAEGSDISTVTSSVTSALSSSKAEFATAIGAVVGVGIGFFLLKFVVLQVINYFKRVAR